MLKFYMFIFTGLFTYHLCAQNKTIAVMDFDETAPQWDFSTDIPFFDNNTDGFFGVHNGDGDDDINDTGISMNANNISAINISNDFLFINDLNDEGDHGTGDKATLRFDPVDISNYHHVTIRFDFEVIAFDASDFIIYEIIEDGQITVSDTLAKNTQGSISTQILNKTNTLDFHLIIKQNGVNEYAAIDNIKLQGDPIIPCLELIISEYVEGTSSGTTFRNNFIEIYNPTNSEIELNNYDLVKYTGKNLEPSAALNLNGIIAGYGTFVIEDDTENLGLDSNLSSNSSVMDFTGDDKIALRKSNKIIDLIGHIGDSINFAKDLTLRRKSHIQNPNNQYNPLEWDSYPLEDISNINTHVTSCSSNIPEIQVMGNAYEIMDGDLHSNFNNNTFFGNINAQQGLHIKKSYSVKNIGNDLLKIDHIEITGTDTSEFLLDNFTDVDINPNDSLVFDIIFTPSSKGIKTAMVNIANNDASENPFNFVIQGEGSGSSDSPLIISQYYEGDGNNRWIEITNTSDAETPDNTYFLALYRNSDAKNPIGIKPTIQKAIPKTSVGQTLKYSASLKVNAPVYAIDGTEIKTNICTFDGDDMLIISTTNDETCWENKIDIIGNSTNWGAEKSFVRKYGCNKVRAKTGFDTNDWLVYEVSEIDAATKGFNQRIGQHFTGAAIFENDQWSNGLPDHYREVIIDHDFHSNIQGNLEACHLTINATKTMHIEADNYLSIQKDLTVNGTLNIWHEGSLLMTDNLGKVNNNGSIQIHKTTTTLKRYDYTYWSSPVKNALLKEVFAASPQNSFYSFETQNFIDTDNNGSDDDENAWQSATDIMETGKGYTAMAPNTSPFIDKQTVVFKGTVNNGILTIPAFLSSDTTNAYDDWNFIGNPYPSALNAEMFLNNENNKDLINGSVYFWTHNTMVEGNKYSSDDYAMYT
ncbi:MAG: lamin tail domain-containing protein, partial [Flavobacteriaceae bacterium]|nr:lamin tail domain-containing protein [Flavobacteriaceae bacterium]